MKTIRIQFRVDKLQHERIINIARAKGFYHTEDYIRYILLEKDLTFERKFQEIHEAILIIVKKLK